MLKSLNVFLHITLLVAFLTGCSGYSYINGDNMAFNKSNKKEDDNNNFDSLKQADELYKQGDYPKAITLYDKLINENSSSETLLYYAESLRLTNNCGKAISIYDRILNNDAANIVASEGKGLCNLVLGKFQAAVEILSQVVSLDDTRWKAVNALGVIYALKGHIEESMEYYNLAIKNNGHNPTVLNNIGLSLAFSGDYKRGKDILAKSVSLVDQSDDEKRKRIELNLALLYGLAGEHNMAKTILEKYFSEAEVMNNLGFYASMANDRELAKVYLSKALSASPSHYEKAWNNLQLLERGTQG
ncbi:MAG: hypothetical protein COV35_04920 [Alphaproteobacteria bacterium CG11_big_fil_rev_8_21_14_0_20_39_49]|nr:MAG: hypothetical protein COV35_04920 [Alphaproteobacteria bacterium CG11_big_fil_rev_8_21_14_0_20_39_49]